MSDKLRFEVGDKVRVVAKNSKYRGKTLEIYSRVLAGKGWDYTVRMDNGAMVGFNDDMLEAAT